MIIELIFDYIYDKKFVYQFIATLSTYLTLKVVNFFVQRHKRYQIFKYYGIPGPKPKLLSGNLDETLAKEIFLRDEQWCKEYGKVFGFFVGDEPIIVISDPDKLKKIFFDESKCFTERCHVFLETSITEGILFARHDRWKFMRKVMSPSFNSYIMRGSKSTQFIEDGISLMINYIDEKLIDANNKNSKANIDIHDLMKSTALYLISKLAINLPNTQVKENEENVNSLDSYLSYSDKGAIVYAIMFPLIKPLFEIIHNNFEVNKTMGMIHDKVNKTIDEELERLKKNDKDNKLLLDTHNTEEQLINILIRLHYEKKMSRIEIMGNIEALLFAGYDTTSTTLTYVFWVLGKYPEVQDKLRDELMSHGVESVYLDQVIKETMRIYPTVMVFTQRLATKTVKIDEELTVPEGAKVVFEAWLMHKNPQLWPEPDKFDPERFRPGVTFHPCAYAPFGLSDRRCLGYNLAILEMKMITCDIVLRYKLKLISPLEELKLVSYAVSLSKPKEKVVIELEKIQR